MEHSKRKVVLITGAAQGQGKNHALYFAQRGYDIVLGDYLNPSSDVFARTIEELKQLGAEVVACKCDITSDEELKNLFFQGWEKFGRLDAVIANAGIINFGKTWELSDEEVDKVVDVNLKGTWRTNKYAARYMLKQGFGRIINISSTSGLRGTPYLATYCMSKWGIIGLTKTLALELKSSGIMVNALCPTKVKTPMCETPEYIQFINDITGEKFENASEMYQKLDGKNKGSVAFLDVEEISSMCYWLADSKEAGKFTGREIALDLGTLL